MVHVIPIMYALVWDSRILDGCSRCSRMTIENGKLAAKKRQMAKITPGSAAEKEASQ
jgi:hypothetical protein